MRFLWYNQDTLLGKSRKKIIVLVVGIIVVGIVGFFGIILAGLVPYNEMPRLLTCMESFPEKEFLSRQECLEYVNEIIEKIDSP